MHCTSCSRIIENTLNSTPNISKSKVNFWNNMALIEFDESKISENEIIKIIEKTGYTASREEFKPEKETRTWLNKSIFGFVLSIPLIVFMIYDFFKNLPYHNEIMPYMAIISLIISTILQFTLGLAFYKWFFSALRQKTANMYSLIAIWTTTAFVYSIYSFTKFYLETWSLFGLNSMKIEWIYFEVSALLITFVCFWKYLESKAKSKTSEAISKLISLTPKTAFVKINFEFIEKNIEEIKIWDIILVKPWDKIPVDWKIIVWNASIDESMLTWESLPTDKIIWDKVLAWTINKYTSFELEATQIWAWTMLSQIINLLEEAGLSKSNIEWFADRVSKIFVPVVIILSILTFLVWYFILSSTFENSLLLACSVVVIACPCALWLATPTTVIVWTWIWAKNWILIKWGSALEKANYITAVALDKTWTITIWKPVLQDLIIIAPPVRSSLSPSIEGDQGGVSDEFNILKIIYSLENNSNHPISKAITNYAKEKNTELIKTSNFKIINWKWIVWKVEDVEYFVWNKALVLDYKIDIKEDISNNYERLINEWKTVLFLWNNEEILALVSVSDEVKETSKNAINLLKNMWIEVFMITWDNKQSANYIANQVWIKEENIFAEVLPQDKWNIVKQIQKSWQKVAMVWDWINDSIAMVNSDLAIWMWSWNDVALESSDIVLMKNDLNDIVKAIDLSQKTVWKIKENLFFSLFYNSMWIPIASWTLLWFGLFLKPELAWLAMALSSVSVVVNSLLLKLSMKNKYFSFMTLSILLIIFSWIFVSFASLNKTDNFTKSYTLNNEIVLKTITNFVLNSKNKINIEETLAPKIFLFTDKIPENIALKSWINSLKQDEMVVWYMEAKMMIELWLIKWVWSELTNFFWLKKVKIVWILAKTDTFLDDVHILNISNYEKLIWDDKSLKFFATPDMLALRTFYLFDETNIPEYFKDEIKLNETVSGDYLNMFVWFLDANMMIKLWLVKNIWDKLNDFFWNNVIYYKKLKKTYTSYDMMHFIVKK